MVGTTGGVGGQNLQQPIQQTFQPGGNEQQRQVRESNEQSQQQNTQGVQSNNQVRGGQQGEQVAARAVQQNVQPDLIENNPDARRGEIVNIVV